MKQMRSRFRLLTLVLTCAFLLALALCTGNILRTAGITLSSLSSLPASVLSPEPFSGPDSSAVPDASAEPGSSLPESSADSALTPAPSGDLPGETASPGTDIFTDPEYNTFGL